MPYLLDLLFIGGRPDTRPSGTSQMGNPEIFNLVSGVLVGVFMSIILFQFIFRKRNYRTYIVAIIGLPKSGKTTLIVSLFQEILYRRIRYAQATLHGKSTIERVNDLIEKKESGIAVGPTNDQTMFAYRTSIEPVARGGTEYRLEIGDYPGEYSEKLFDDKYFDELKKSDFFAWCVEANAYIFVVDVGKYLTADDKGLFIASTSKVVRESWQHFKDHTFVTNKKMLTRPTLLIFNKMDLCKYFVENSVSAVKTIDNDLLFADAYSNYMLPAIRGVDEEKYNDLSQALQSDFGNLISYLNSECSQFDVLFTSSFAIKNGSFVDVDKILKSILPRSHKSIMNIIRSAFDVHAIRTRRDIN